MSHKPHYTAPVHEHIDQWHHHTPDEGAPQVEHGAKPNTLILLAAFIGSVAFVAVTILATYIYFGVYTRTLRAERIENTALGKEFRDYQQGSFSKLEQGNVWWSDEAARAGRVTIPLARAQASIIAKYAAK